MRLTKLRYISPEMNYQVFHLTSACRQHYLKNNYLVDLADTLLLE